MLQNCALQNCAPNQGRYNHRQDRAPNQGRSTGAGSQLARAPKPLDKYINQAGVAAGFRDRHRHPASTKPKMNLNTPTFIVQSPGTALPVTDAKKKRCDNCKKKKRGCDRQSPCSGCKHLNIPCTYSGEKPDRQPSKRQKRSVPNQESSDSDDEDPVVNPWKILQSSTFFERLEVLEALVCPTDDRFRTDSEIKSRTPLHWAASNGYFNIVKLLVVEFHMNVNAQSAMKVTPLHLAARNGHVKVVTFLAMCGADVKAKDGYAETPLYLAAKNGHVEVIKRLQTEFGAEINSTHDVYGSPLHEAVGNGHLDAVKLLVALGADKNCISDGTPLEIAAEKGHTEMVRSLIGGSKMPIDAITWALILATENGHIDIVKLLLTEDHVYANVREPYDGITPLHTAATKGDVSIARMLITEFHADKDSLDNSGETPLHHAVSSGKIEVAKMLVNEYGANAYAKTNNYETLLHLAAKCDKTEIVEWLIAEFGADLNTKDKLNQTPLHKAATNGSRKTVELLGDLFGDIDARDINGKTPLHLAAENGKVSVVTLLVNRFHAGVKITDNLGQTPLHVAVRCDSCKRTDGIQVVDFLLNHVDVDINAMDSNNLTPLDLATKNGFIGAVKAINNYTRRLQITML